MSIQPSGGLPADEPTLRVGMRRPLASAFPRLCAGWPGSGAVEQVSSGQRGLLQVMAALGPVRRKGRQGLPEDSAGDAQFVYNPGQGGGLPWGARLSPASGGLRKRH